MATEFTPGKNTQNGFTLVEVLAALLILSIGMLGVAALQTTSKRLNYEATQRTTAIMLANDLIERMRANPDELATYTGVSGTTITGSLTQPSPYCNAASVNCTAAQIAAYDLYEWQQAILGVTEVKSGVNTGGLVLPTGCISPGANAGEVSVAIAWRGLTKLSNPIISTCGSTSGNYNETGTDNVFRRVIVINTFIDQ